MASIRAVVVDMEGTDATVLEAIRSFVGRTNGLPVPGGQNSLAPAAAIQPRAIEAAVAPLVRGASKANRKVGKGVAPKNLPEAKVATRRKYGPGAPDPLGRTVDAADVNAEAAARAGKTSGCRALVYDALQHGPLTSGELVSALPKYTPSSIYLALKELRQAETVKTHEVDGEMRNERIA